MSAYRNNIDKTFSILGGNAQVLEKDKHILPDGFIEFIDQTPIFRFATGLGFADTGENGTDDPVERNDQRADHTDGFWWNGVLA